MKRREFIRTAGGVAGGTVAATAPVTAQQSNTTSAGKSSGSGGTKTYKLGGKVAGWQGQAPSSIKGKTNPPLVFKPGQKYTVIWENLDGATHDFTIKDSGGKTITKTETMSNKGQTLSLTFTATAKMAEYICTIHPSSMQGTIQQSATTGGGSSGPTVPDSAKTLGVAAMSFMLSTLGLAYIFMRYGGDFGEAGRE